MATPLPPFSARLHRLRSDVVEQGRRVQAMLESAFDALFGRDMEKASLVAAQDDVIDRVDVEIERATVALLTDATRQGAQLDPGELRLALTIAKVNNELERAADLAVDLAELTASAAKSPSPFPDTFRVMANSIIGILRDTNTSMLHGDASLAKVVLQSQHTVTAFKKAIIRDAEEKIAAGKMTVDFAFLLHEVANLSEVLADHCTNIAEQVIYLTTGATVRHMATSWVELPRPAAG